MALATVNDLSIGYDVIGDSGRPWSITPGGRFDRTTPGVRELAEALAADGNRVLIWDRPNTGESDVCFDGDSESAMQADALAGLLQQLDMTPAVIMGGSGGARVSLLTAARHRDAAVGVAVLWVTGGTFGLMSLATHYCGESIRAAFTEGMAAVAALPEWSDVLEKNPSNRERFLAQDPKRFVATLEQWMAIYCSCEGDTVPGLPDDEARRLEVPALVFRSGASDLFHRRETTERLAGLLPQARLVEPPWRDNEWNERSAAAVAEGAGLFVRWPLLAPQLLEWAAGALPRH